MAQVPDPVTAAAAPIPGSGHHYIGTGAETVNPADGLLSFDLPLQPAVGRQLSFNFGIRFSGAEQFNLTSWSGGPELRWIPSWSGITTGPIWELNGWSYDLPTLTARTQVTQEMVWYPTPDNPKTVRCLSTNNYVFRGLDGTQRTLALGSMFRYSEDGPPPDPHFCPTVVVPYASAHGVVGWSPGQYNTLPPDPPVTVTDQSGTTYQFPGYYQPSSPNYQSVVLASSITDRNGNKITVGANSATDTLGRTAVSWSGMNGTGGDTITVAGLGGNVSIKWTTTHVDFLSEEGHNIGGTNPICYFGNSGSYILNVVREIDLPNGQKYSFLYDGTHGKVSKITFPGGGYVRYLWDVNPSSAVTQPKWYDQQGYTHSCTFVFDVPAIADRFVSYDGTNEVLQQHFAYSTTWNGGQWTSKQTTVTTTDLLTNQSTKTVYNYIPTSPDNGGLNWTSNWGSQVPIEQSVLYQTGSGSTLKTVNKTWLNLMAMKGEQTILDNGPGMTSLRCYDANEQVTQVYEYGFHSEGTKPADPFCVSSTDLDVSAIGPLRRQTTTIYHPYFQGFPPGGGNMLGTHILNAPDSITVYDGSGNPAKQTSFGYTNTVSASGASTGLVTPPGPDRANIASMVRRVDASNSVTSSYTWFDTGQLKSMTDACGNSTCGDMAGAPNNHTTTYSYTDSYANGTGTPPGQTNAYLTSVTYPNTGVAHSESFTWGYSDGQIRSRTDQNGQTASFQYETDKLSRLTEIDYPDNGKATVTYNDSTFHASTSPPDAANNTPNFTVSKVITSSVSLVATTAFDGMGHTVRTLLTSDPEGTDITDTVYSGLAQEWKGLNPYRSTSDPTYGITQNAFDPLGRVTQTTMQDGTLSKVQTTYSDNCTTVTDEAGKSRQSCTDGLGRMTKVVEDPGGLNYETAYQYDVLDNLTRVDQKGGTTDSSQWHTRTFTYDSLSRLLSATNPELGTTSHPEWGTITYTYDANGNVATKIAPKPNTIPAQGALTLTTTYSYDNANRLVQKSYSDGTTPTVKYGYDGVALSGCTPAPPSLTDSYPKPLRTSMCDGSGVTSWNHDKMGRILNEARKLVTTSTVTKTTSYTYNLDGSLATLTYPSLRMVTYGVNAAGRLISAADVANSISYVSWDCPQSLYCYAPSGAELRLRYGAVGSFAGIATGNAFNSRLQPSVLSAAWSGGTIISRNYDFQAGNGDNGNVFQIRNNLDNARTQNFTYDALNRITSAETQGSTGDYCWGQRFGHMDGGNFVSGIDAWGNLTEITATNGQCASPTLMRLVTTQNQFSEFCYDLAGNLLSQFGACPDSLPYNPVYVYDAENRLRSINQTITPYYIYDGDGKRVIKNYIANRLYWTGTGSDTLTETDTNGNATADYIYANGRRVARLDLPGGTVHYYFSDHLGSASVIAKIVNNNNNYTVVVERDSDYLPYGTERVITGSDSNRYKFTGKERDSESGLDNFGARYDSSGLGRFLTPDPLLNSGRPWAPQTWNRYAYSQNNPLRKIDPSGLYDYDVNCKKGTAGDACRQDQKRLDDAVAKATELLATLPKGSKQYSELKKSLDAIGTRGDKNGVKVGFGQTGTGGPMETRGKHIQVDWAKFDAAVTAYKEYDYDVKTEVEAASQVGHEGVHLQRQTPMWAANRWDIAENIEAEAYGVQSSVSEAGNSEDRVWNNDWASTADREVLRQNAISRAAKDSMNATRDYYYNHKDEDKP